MGALDRIVSADGGGSDGPREAGAAARSKGTVAQGAGAAPVAAEGRPADDTQAVPAGVESQELAADETRPAGTDHDAPRERHDRARRDRPASAQTDDAAARVQRRTLDDEAEPERGRAAVVPASTTARRADTPRDRLARFFDPSAQSPRSPSRPLPPPGGEPARERERPVPEVRREQVVRERIIERTIVERLLEPARTRKEGPDARERTIPSLVRAPQTPPERRVPNEAPSEGRGTSRSPSPDGRDRTQDRQRLETDRDREPKPRGLAPNGSSLADQRRSDVHRLPDRGAEHAPLALVAGPTATDRARHDETRREPRAPGEGRARTLPAATRPRAPAAPRPTASLVAPKPQPAEKTPADPKRAAPPVPARGADAGRSRPDAAAARAAQQPRVQISIGRVEIRGRAGEPAIQRISAGGPRAHQIDPGLPFGPLEGGRI